MIVSGIKIVCRPNSVDESIAYDSIVRDDYKIRQLAKPDELLIDLGAYAGHVSLLAASLGMRAVAVEPLPANVAAIQANIRANGFEDRITVIQGAVGVENLFWNDPSEEIIRHRFVANSSGSPKAEQISVKKVRLDDVVHVEPHILKTDCEGGEWSLGCEQVAQKARYIVGEFHPPGSFADFKAMFPDHTDVSHQYGFSGTGLRLFVFKK
jgi:FkbM family methyltransferase